MGTLKAVPIWNGMASFDDLCLFQGETMTHLGRNHPRGNSVGKQVLQGLSHGGRSLSRSNQEDVLESRQVKEIFRALVSFDSQCILFNGDDLSESFGGVNGGHGPEKDLDGHLLELIQGKVFQGSNLNRELREPFDSSPGT